MQSHSDMNCADRKKLVHVALELGSPRSCNLLIKVYMFTAEFFDALVI